MSRLTFSANLGFLWTELPLPDAIHAAKAAGFDAVECHWPYDVPRCDVKHALRETGLPMLGLNTRRGGDAEFGLTALPGREDDARAAIDEALDYASAVGARHVHVMAGNAAGVEAHECFVQNLRYATAQAKPLGIALLIEPLNAVDAPEYFLRTLDQATRVLDEVGCDTLRLMFDCYHVGRTEGEVAATLTKLLPRIGHIQFAAVPDRGAPDHGAVDYMDVFARVAQLGWTAPLGAEYRPSGSTEESLDWLRKPRSEQT